MRVRKLVSGIDSPSQASGRVCVGVGVVGVQGWTMQTAQFISCNGGPICNLRLQGHRVIVVLEGATLHGSAQRETLENGELSFGERGYEPLSFPNGLDRRLQCSSQYWPDI